MRLTESRNARSEQLLMVLTVYRAANQLRMAAREHLNGSECSKAQLFFWYEILAYGAEYNWANLILITDWPWSHVI